MEQVNKNEKKFKLSFDGKGFDYFLILLVNVLLTMLTLTLYYPWARARELRFMYSATALNGERFSFTGSGKEMFIGYLKAVLIMSIIMGIYIWMLLIDMQIAAIIVLYLLLILLIPIALHGSYRYRMSRTVWRGIRFGYRGQKNELIPSFIKWFFLSLITFGIYGAWMSVNLNKYVLSNIRAGNVAFKFDAKGSDYFWILLKGYLLSIITLGIYGFWWYKDIFAFYVNHLKLENETAQISFRSKATAGDVFSLLLPNILIIIFTLGLGLAWVETRSMKFMCDMIEMEGDIDLDALQQTEEDYSDATGQGLTDFFDIDLI